MKIQSKYTLKDIKLEKNKQTKQTLNENTPPKSRQVTVCLQIQALKRDVREQFNPFFHKTIVVYD